MRLFARVSLFLLAACGPPKDPSSGIAGGELAPTNESDLQRYPDEAPVHENQSVEWRAAPVRHAHPDGRLIAILTRGNTVAKIARRGDFFLVTFPNPTNPSQRWGGWVHKKVFLVGTEAYPPLGNPQPCQSDSDCTAPAKCGGVASTAATGLDGFRFCTGP